MKSSTLHYSKKKVFGAIEQALEQLEMEIEESVYQSGKITTYFGGNLLSFGNKVDIHIKTVNPTKSIIKVDSRSAAQIQVIDWGTNTELEEKIINEIKCILNP